MFDLHGAEHAAGRYVAEVFDSYADYFVDEYLGPSGRLDPKTAVRFYDLCQLLYEGGLDFEGPRRAGMSGKSVPRSFAEGYDLEELLPVSILLLNRVAASRLLGHLACSSARRWAKRWVSSPGICLVLPVAAWRSSAVA